MSRPWRTFHLPNVLSLGCLLVATLSLVLHWALLEGFILSLPPVFVRSPETASALLLLAAAVRLARWERIDLRISSRGKLSRVLAGLAILMTLTTEIAPTLPSTGLCLLATVLILQANGELVRPRRVLLGLTLISATWLVLASLYQVRGTFLSEFTAEPATAVLMLALTLSLSLHESCNGLIPTSFQAVLGEVGSRKLLLGTLLTPLILGYLRMEMEESFFMDTNLLLALQVLGTLLVMALLLNTGMELAEHRLLQQRRIQSDLEATETLLRLLLETGSEYYLAMNLAGRLVHANESAMRTFELPNLQKRVVCMEDLVEQESRELLQRLPESLLRGVSGQEVVWFRLPKGGAVPLNVTAACRTNQGEPAQIVLVARTLPDRQRAANDGSELLATA